MPLTPGDASFRTAELDAPLASSDPFGLTYSLGEVVQLVPAEGGGAGGFVPAAGGAEGFVPAAGGLDGDAGSTTVPDDTCNGWVSTGVAPPPGCEPTVAPESFWDTRAGGVP